MDFNKDLYGPVRNALFQGLRSENFEERKKTLETIEQTFKGWADAPPEDSSIPNREISTPQSGTSSTTSTTLSTSPIEVIDPVKPQNLLDFFILTILCMSISCPYADVRRAFKKLLKKLKNRGVSIPSPVYEYPSLYIPPGEILSLEWLSGDEPSSTPTSSLSPGRPIGIIPDEDTRNLMCETFINIGRLSNYYRVLCYFPTFTRKYQDAYNELVKSDNGTLTRAYKYYIGIMASSEYNCQYLVSHLKNEYLYAGGNREWLDGLEHAPPKIRRIAKINNILAHRPWRLEAKHIRELSVGSTPPDTWSNGEIVNIIVLLCTFHSFSSFVLSCGIVPEYDSADGHRRSSTFGTQPSYDNNETGASIALNSPELIPPGVGSGLGIHDEESHESPKDDPVEVEESHESPKDDEVEESHESPKDDPVEVEESHESPKDDEVEESHESPKDDEVEESHESPKDDEVEESHESPEDDPVEGESHGDDEFVNCEEEALPIQTTEKPSACEVPLAKDFSDYLDIEARIPYFDLVFNKQGHNRQINSIGFSWRNQGILMVNNYMHFGDQPFGELLDEEFKNIKRDDKPLPADSEVNDLQFREAVWYYIHRLYGIYEDGYEHRKINDHLNNKMMSFIKKVCIKPEDFTHEDWNSLEPPMSEQEKCCIVLISVESRKRAALLHGLWCVNECKN